MQKPESYLGVIFLAGLMVLASDDQHIRLCPSVNWNVLPLAGFRP